MIPRGTHVSCRFRYSVIASLTISRKDIPFLMARYFILVWMLLLIRKLQCTGTSVVSETDTGGAGVVSVTICSLLGFFVEERSPLRPPFHSLFQHTALAHGYAILSLTLLLPKTYITGTIGFGIILKDSLAVDGCFCQSHIITDDGLENLLVKTVIDDFPHASVQRLAAIELGDDDAAHFKVGVEPLLNDADDVHQLCHTSHGKVLRLNRDDDVVGCGEGIQGQQAQ